MKPRNAEARPRDNAPDARRAAINPNRTAAIRFFCMAALLPSFLIHDNLALKAVQLGVFTLLAAAVGKRIHPVRSLIVALSIIIFHLLSPYGRVLAELGPFRLTWGALEEGLIRALTFTGLLFLSRFGVSRDLSLPGAAGDFLRRVFADFDVLMAWDRGKERGAAFWAGLDRFLCGVYDAPVSAGPTRAATPASRLLTIGAVAALAASWAAVVVVRILSSGA